MWTAECRTMEETMMALTTDVVIEVIANLVLWLLLYCCFWPLRIDCGHHQPTNAQ